MAQRDLELVEAIYASAESQSTIEGMGAGY
jgi:hypothetical protein